MKHEKQGITVAGSLIADTFYKIDTYPEAGMLTKARGSRQLCRWNRKSDSGSCKDGSRASDPGKRSGWGG